MRSLGRNLLLVADVLAALSAAGVLVSSYVRPQAFGVYDEKTRTLAVAMRGNAALELAVLAALLLLTINVLYFVYGRRPREPLRWVSSQGPGGDVRVAREALESGLRSAGEALDGVTRLRVVVEPGASKRIVVRAFFQAPEGAPILEASRRLREALAERFHEMVHIADGTKVEFAIEFVGFGGKLVRRGEPKEAEAPPFTGPKYPIEEDEGDAR